MINPGAGAKHFVIYNCCEMPGRRLLVNPIRLQHSSVASIVGDTTAVPSRSTGEPLSFSSSSDPAVDKDVIGYGEKRDGKDDPECLDNHKMIRVCDKLIEVFMVDKPTPTDWRRLLAFSKEWSNIRPHFYRRCQDRADSEGDPGKKHSLLRLGRKLKEVSGTIPQLTFLEEH